MKKFDIFMGILKWGIGIGLVLIVFSLGKDIKEADKKARDDLHMAYFNEGYTKGVKITRISALEAGVGHYVISNPTNGATEWEWTKEQ